MQHRLYLPPPPTIHVPRAVEQDLVAALTTFSGYRLARWRAIILHGMAGIGKTVIARTLADDETVARAFRDGIAWVDGSRNPAQEVMRLCHGFHLERTPCERCAECWQSWAGACERRLLLIIDDAVSAGGLPPLIAGLGPQVVVLITTQLGAEIRAEVERWLPAAAVMELGIHGLTPSEGRALVEAVIGRPATTQEWAIVQEIGEEVGWHPEALRLAAIEGREVNWQGALEELKAGRIPWEELRRLIMRQWLRLHPEQREWLNELMGGMTVDAWLATDDIARLWQAHRAVAERRLWILAHEGLIDTRAWGRRSESKTHRADGSPDSCRPRARPSAQ